jgi:sigma-B regulation protein RsbU (phosphoserine phosphatase)
MKFGIEQIEIEPGDTLFAFTDGAMDVRDPQGESFGEEQLLSLVHQPAPCAADLLERVMANLNRHMAGSGQFDDITLLAARRAQSA